MAKFETGAGQTVRECGCLGVGRHRNSCPAKAAERAGLDGGATLPQMESVRPQMSPPVPHSATVATEVWRGPKDGAALAAPLATPAETFYGLPVMPDDWMEQYGGDLAALESYSEKSGRPMATRQSSLAASRAQPDLNYKGMLVYRHDPAKLFHFVYVLEDGSSNYQQAMGTIRQRGCKPVTVADFYVHSTLRDGVFVSDDGTANGRLTLGGALKGGATVIYRQDERSYNEWRKYDRRFSDQIQLTADEQASRLQDQLAGDGFAGVIATATFE